MGAFQREHRYYVFKIKHCSEWLRRKLAVLNLGQDRRATPTCVVVEEDWPEYEIVWDLIQQRVEGGAAVEVTDRLLGRIAQQDNEIERLRSELAATRRDEMHAEIQRLGQEKHAALARVEALEQFITDSAALHFYQPLEDSTDEHLELCRRLRKLMPLCIYDLSGGYAR